MSGVTAFPLAWPAGWPRTDSREDSRFRFKGASSNSGMYGRSPVTFDVARKKLCAELDRLGAINVVISTNLPVRADGMPMASAAARRIDDPGVAVYFTLKKRPMVMACDRYDAPSANMRSVGLAIEAMRKLERHGGGAMMERAFAGFAALPAPGGEEWRNVLGFAAYKDDSITASEIDTHFRIRAKDAHPDRGGSNERMARLTQAREQAHAWLAVRS